MTSDNLGRRYERLLFLSGPLTVVAALILLIAFASTTQNERMLANCLGVAIKTLDENKEQLNNDWNTYTERKKKSKYFVNNYQFALTGAWISPGIHSGCHKEIEPLLQQGADTPPEKLIEGFSARASQLRSTPLQFKGIEIPQKIDVGILGTNIKINLDSLTALLQMSLAPVLIIWLGSLYNTRYRETLFVGKSDDISIIFPHLINFYPAGELPALRKRSRFAYWFPPTAIICTLYSLTRLCLIAFVILPTIGCYLASIFLLPIEGMIWLSVIGALLISIFSLSVLVVEVLPWHASKIFPGAAKR